MEGFSTFILIVIFIWGSYIFGIGVYGGMILAGILGWKKDKNRGFLLILISGCMRLLHHLPSIYFKGYYAVRRLSVEDYGKLMLNWSYVDNTVIPLATLLLVIGLFFITVKDRTKNTEVKSNDP
jgi:hypothetical protein